MVIAEHLLMCKKYLLYFSVATRLDCEVLLPKLALNFLKFVFLFSIYITSDYLIKVRAICKMWVEIWYIARGWYCNIEWHSITSQNHALLYFFYRHIIITFSEYCPAGQQLVGASCEQCARGYYKDNANNVARFESCSMCPVDKITSSTGATSRDQCTIGQLVHLL